MLGGVNWGIEVVTHDSKVVLSVLNVRISSDE